MTAEALAQPKPHAVNSTMLRLVGVRVNNLKNLDVEIPLGKFTVLTGVSGSGKSSLALDALHAEGRRRFLETLPSDLRKRFPPFDRPDLDFAHNLPPSVAVGQFDEAGAKSTTLAAALGVLDALAALLTAYGVPFCDDCLKPMIRTTPEALAERLAADRADTVVIVGIPTSEPPTAEFVGRWQALGFSRASVGGNVVRLDDPAANLVGASLESVFVVVDRITLDGSTKSVRRLAEAIEIAQRFGAGSTAVELAGRWMTFARGLACPTCGKSAELPEPKLFQPDRPENLCSTCDGAGTVAEFDPLKTVPDRDRSIRMGAVRPLVGDARKEARVEFFRAAKLAGLDLDADLKDYSAEAFAKLVHGHPPASFGGLAGLAALFAKKALAEYSGERSCADCAGSGLAASTRAFRLADWSLAEWLTADVSTAAEKARALSYLGVARLQRRLDAAVRVGIGYLELGRTLGTLSTGEARRAALAAALGAPLSETLFIFDEPTAGLHPADVETLVAALRQLQADGNTLVVVEHDLDVIRAADHALELGPGAGADGGQLTFVGEPKALAKSDTATGRFLDPKRRPTVKRLARTPTHWLVANPAGFRNLRDTEVRLPLGVFAAVAGVSGAGKSSLVFDWLRPRLEDGLAGAAQRLPGAEQIDEVAVVDGDLVGRSHSSNAATYLKFFDDVRREFAATAEAKSSGLGAAAFSFNLAAGACPACRGAGVLSVDMQFLPRMSVVCSDCKGTRYRREVLRVKYRGRTVAETLALSAREAFGFFRGETAIQEKVKALVDVGLGYMTLGQPTAAYSGGEIRRLKLAAALGQRTSRRTLFLLDEPTAGLHSADVSRLLECLDALVAVGHSLLAVDHHPLFLAHADHIVELGPGAGPHGGQVVAAGTPAEIVAAETPTGKALAPYLGKRR